MARHGPAQDAQHAERDEGLTALAPNGVMIQDPVLLALESMDAARSF
jgi:hypothetical protein